MGGQAASGVSPLAEADHRLDERFGELLSVRLASKFLRFARVRDKPELEERRRHLDLHQHDEGRLLDAPRTQGVEAREPGLHDLRELLRLAKRFVVRELAQDGGHRIEHRGVGHLGRAESQVLASRERLRRFIRRVEGREESLRSTRVAEARRVRVHGNEEVRLGPISELRPLLESDEAVFFARQEHLKAALPKSPRRPLRDIEDQLFFDQTRDTPSSVVVSAVAGIDDNRVEVVRRRGGRRFPAGDDPVYTGDAARQGHATSPPHPREGSRAEVETRRTGSRLRFSKQVGNSPGVYGIKVAVRCELMNTSDERRRARNRRARFRALFAATIFVGGCLVPGASSAADPEILVARPQFEAEGRAQAGSTCFFVRTDDVVGSAAVCAAHSLPFDELALSPMVDFRLGKSQHRVARSTRFFAKPGRAFSLPGGSFSEDLVSFSLEAPPADVGILEAAQGDPQVGSRVRIVGVPAGVPADQDDLVGIVAAIESDRIHVDLDVSVDLRGWGGAPALDDDGRLIGMLQAAWIHEEKYRLGLTRAADITEHLATQLASSEAAFSIAAGPATPQLDSIQPGLPPGLNKKETSDVPTLAGPRAEPREPDDVSLTLTVEYPPNDAIIGDPMGAFVAGKAYALEGRLRRFDVIFVVDTSGSTNEMTGTDINENGVVGKSGLFGRADDGDSILAAEIAAATQMLRGFDPRGTRVGLVTFAGDPRTGFPPRQGRAAAITEEPLTSDYAKIERAMRSLLERKPQGMTHMAAGVDQATIELLGLRGGLSEPDPSSEKIVLFFTDGRPTLPYDPVFESENVKAVLRAADRSARASITIHSFAIGPEALDGPVATVEMAARTDGYFTPVRHPGELTEIVDTVSFANVERLELRNLTANTDAQEVLIKADGSWSALVPLEAGKNRVSVTAYGSDGSSLTEEVTLQYAPDAPSPTLPREFVTRRNQLLERRLIELKRESDEMVEQTRRELKIEIDRERAEARERAERQRKELELKVDPDAE